MLPYTPLHHLLLAEVGRPIVLTSGNVSDEPIAYRDDEAVERLGGIADGFLTHDRPIHVRADDSVVRAFRGRELPLRRSRGFAPQPLGLPWPFPRHVLACGAELKNTFCLAKGGHAFVSHHIGDLENYETFRSFTEGVEHFRRLFDVEPEVVAHDLHPEYLSTKYALELDGVELEGVQHHHAHIASCLADNGEPGPVIGVAFDGLGYGADGTIWGGELLVADLAGFRRAGHLEAVPMPGGAAAIREPWRMAAAWLDAAFGGQVPERPGRGRAQPGPLGAGGRPWPGRARPRRRPPAPAGCSTRCRRSWASGTRSTTRARRRSSWSSWPTRPRRPPTRPGSRAPGATARRCSSAGATWSARWSRTWSRGARPADRRPLPQRPGRRRPSPPARHSATPPAWGRWPCPAACSRTSCSWSAPSPAWSSGASGSWSTPGSRPTTAASASARPRSPAPGRAQPG